MFLFFFSIIMGTTAFANAPQPKDPSVIRRAAIDVGSGKTKITVADVKQGDSGQWQIDEILWKREEVLKFSDDLTGSAEGVLSDEIQERGISLLKRLKSTAVQEYGVQQFSCIATEVFRKAKNGGAFVERIQKEVGIPVYLITQDQEASLGFTTGSAIAGLPPEQSLVIDHGSGSFQISGKEEGTLSAYNSTLGTIPLAKALLEKVQNLPYKPGTAPLPLSSEEAIAFIQFIHSELAQPPSWLSRKIGEPHSKVIGLAGPSGTFGMCSTITGKKDFSQEELWQSIERLFNTDEQQIKQTYPTIYDPSLLPRVLFVYSLMTYLNVDQITWVQSNGCTEGMLITPSLWLDQGQS